MSVLITPLFIVALFLALVAAWLSRPSVAALILSIGVAAGMLAAVIWRLV